MRTPVPFTSQASMNLLCKTSHQGWKELTVTNGLIFPCDPVMLWGCGIHHSQSAMPIPICHLSQVCFTTGTWCALCLLIQHPETHLQDLIFAACNCPLESLPCHQVTAKPETSLVLFLVHLPTQPMVLLSLPERQYCCLEQMTTSLFF